MLKMLQKEQQKILIVTGNSNYKAHSERVEGFRSVIRSAKKPPSISGVIETKNNPSLTRKLVSEALENDKYVDAIYVASADVEEFTRLLEEMDKKHRVVVNDLYPCVERALKNETIDFTLCNNPYIREEAKYYMYTITIKPAYTLSTFITYWKHIKAIFR
jgi:LacI family transcriptional regulator